MSDFICPYCFEHANTNEVVFQCINPDCTSMYNRDNETFSADNLPDGEISQHQTTFSVPATNGLLRMFGFKNPAHVECPMCGYKTSIRVCPKCRSPFPHGVDDLSNMVIAIVGAKETGKSHYIALLIKRINELYRDFNWSLYAMNDETMNLYNNQFFNPLYGESPRTLRVTQTARSNQNVKTPLIYTLSTTQKNKYKAVTLAFFDTAGEDMDDAKQMALINRYIYNASGIIFLFDPLQFESVQNKLIKEKGFTKADLPQSNNTYAGNIFNRVVNVIQNGKGLSNQKKIPIPIAIAFSKIDMLKEELGVGSRIFQPSSHRGSFNLREFSDIDRTIRDWIDEMDKNHQGSFVQQASIFENSGFFGVSALGCNPANGRLPFIPRPIRVEDPFLWLLYKNHIIKGVQS